MDETLQETMTTDAAPPPPDWEDVAEASADAQKPEAARKMIAVRQQFTSDELKKRVDDIGVAIKQTGELALVEERAKEAYAAAKKATAAADAKWRALSLDVTSGYGDVEVECEERVVFEQNAIEWVRLDNGEVAKTEPMSGDRRQTSLFEREDTDEQIDADTGEYVDDGRTDVEEVTPGDDESPDSDGTSTTITDPTRLLDGRLSEKAAVTRGRRGKS